MDEQARGMPEKERAAAPPDGRAASASQPPPDTEQRPLGALVVVGFLLFTIVVLWFGVFFLDRVRG